MDFYKYGMEILLGYLMITVFASAITDIFWRKIPNIITFSTLVVAISFHFYSGGFHGVFYGLKGAVLGFVCFLIPYVMGGMGAGDVKLMTAIGAILGVNNTLVAFVFIALSGGVLAVGMMLYKKTLNQSLTRIWLSLLYLFSVRDGSFLNYERKELIQDGMPFAVAIAMGVCLYIIYVWRMTGMLPILGPS